MTELNKKLNNLLGQVMDWALLESDIKVLVLVGSYARNEATLESDIDLILMVDRPQKYLENRVWVSNFGIPDRILIEEWGKVRSLRVYYQNGMEVEFGHSSFLGIDLLKFQVCSYSNLNTIDVGVYIVSTSSFQKSMRNYGQKWNGSLTYEKVNKILAPFQECYTIANVCSWD